MKLYNRTVFAEIKKYLGDEIVIVLQGARQVGKTHILLLIQKHLESQKRDVFYFDLEYPDLLLDFNSGVHALLSTLQAKGIKEKDEVFVLIDEIQHLDNPSSFIKIIADHHKNIKLIVSGSSSFEIGAKFTDSLVGRTVRFEIFPLSFEEFLHFKGKSYDLTHAKTSFVVSQLKQLYHEFVRFGGYPRIVLEGDEFKKKRFLLQIIDTYIRKDIRDLANVVDIKKFNDLLYVLASQSGGIVNIRSLSTQTHISYPTLKKYLFILEATFVIKLVKPYSKSPKVEISKNPKVYFHDTGLQSLLWLKDFQHTLLGPVFETNIFSELVKKYGKDFIYYWRTKNKVEVDFVLVRDNKVIPIEAKINFARFDGRAISSFCRRYKGNWWYVVGMEGKKENQHFVYGWEV